MNDDRPPVELRTQDLTWAQWRRLGYTVKRGCKSYRRNTEGKPVFSGMQVVRVPWRSAEFQEPDEYPADFPDYDNYHADEGDR